MTCVHCGGVLTRNGYCRPCAVRAALAERAVGREPTAEELDALEARQRLRLPRWWAEDERRQLEARAHEDRGPAPMRVRAVRTRGEARRRHGKKAT